MQQSIITVLSFQIACNWVPSIIAVNIANKRASKVKNNSKTTLAGGLNVEQSRHSCLTQLVNCWIHKTKDCKEIAAT